jgi:ATP-dependent DNA helicase RecQ
LFESLRALRRKLVDQRGAPAYVVVNDPTLRDMARTRPGSPDILLNIRAVG